ncbi:protein of unknown function [Bradyrhizobium sp. ORS 285]|uniref:hypothetical protein n=1 Tax=Bradyrhizobium sp. ORS 285 TaxID=115808 RepID=UPI000240617A|nr:hypothetical protein [Bradyrhizobium sp. ORS 285]CCD84854.1 hypothetical protein BRAO285_1280026 [Bradyrhizobium sp. ORS 285]SMX55659.1 protein of unknown function [Bradyrhizobium sp. ORS 285]
MGPRFRQDDHLISSLLDLANLRFARVVTEAASPPLSLPLKDGIDELKSLQSAFQIFSDQHSLADSFAVLGLGGFWNPALKSKLYGYLNGLSQELFAMNGTNTGEAGDRGISTALRQNLESDIPYPVYFTTHKLDDDPRVLASIGKPLVYMDDDHLTISFPMTPWSGRAALLPQTSGASGQP